MNRKEDYIAVYDSGVGGISVLRYLVEKMPNERFLYFGDSANAPYGSKSADQVRSLAMAAAERLMAEGIKALVVACNTAGAVALSQLRQAYPELIIVGIEPAVKLAARMFPGGKIGVLATQVTLREEKFRLLAQSCAEECEVTSLPAPGLAALVEQGKANSPEAKALLSPILEPVKDSLDALVLGCTHYPFAAQTIREILGRDMPLLDGGEGTARETCRRLKEAELLFDGPGELRWENSLNEQRIRDLSQMLLESELDL